MCCRKADGDSIFLYFLFSHLSPHMALLNRDLTSHFCANRPLQRPSISVASPVLLKRLVPSGPRFSIDMSSGEAHSCKHHGPGKHHHHHKSVEGYRSHSGKAKLYGRRALLIALYCLAGFTLIYFYFPSMSATPSSVWTSIAKDVKALVDGTPSRHSLDSPFSPSTDSSL
jgi:hypothetical protein